MKEEEMLGRQGRNYASFRDITQVRCLFSPLRQSPPHQRTCSSPGMTRNYCKEAMLWLGTTPARNPMSTRVKHLELCQLCSGCDEEASARETVFGESTVTRPHGHTATRLHGHTATRPHGHTATRPHGHTATFTVIFTVVSSCLQASSGFGTGRKIQTIICHDSEPKFHKCRHM